MKLLQMLVVNLSLGYAIFLNTICPCKPHLSCHSSQYLVAIGLALVTYMAGDPPEFLNHLIPGLFQKCSISDANRTQDSGSCSNCTLRESARHKYPQR